MTLRRVVSVEWWLGGKRGTMEKVKMMSAAKS